MITTLEPCTTRSHDKHPCVSWIKSRRIRKVWIGTLDYNPSISGKGELSLLKEGILIGRFPDDLTRDILMMNREFFTSIELKQPTITSSDLKEERLFFIDLVRDIIGKQAETTLSEELREILNRTIALETDSPNQWCIIGSLLHDVSEPGLSWLAYSIASRIDASFQDAWLERARLECEMNVDQIGWPIYEPIMDDDPTPQKVRSESWFQLAEVESENPIHQLKYATRAMQLGKRDNEIWQLIMNSIQQIENGAGKITSNEKFYLTRLLKTISGMWLFNVEDREKWDRIVETLTKIDG
ncbi:MAG: hypothetical protein E4H14_15680 [Candidatus Thorarchaeota archaeon]|nr:MAG: hypothetical protein E4H14_15680 [Candidatus Thorarchaeota archaeon]